MPIALALGVLTGCLVFVPYLGALGAYTLTVVIALAISPRLALEATAVYAGVHLLEGYAIAGRVPCDTAHREPSRTGRRRVRSPSPRAGHRPASRWHLRCTKISSARDRMYAVGDRRGLYPRSEPRPRAGDDESRDGVPAERR